MLKTTAASKPPRWQRVKSSPLGRQREVFGAAGTFLFLLWLDRKLGRNSAEVRSRRARWLVQKLLDLGPTFIKIGQALSTRADLLPREYVLELGKLQDNVPPFSVEEAIGLIESQFDKPIYSLYKEFYERPIAAASLGQVHKAILYTGEEVVVKVQRPVLEDLFRLDFLALGKLVRFCRQWFPWMRKYNLEAIYQEFFSILYQEIDYIQEAKNSERFRRNFQDNPRIIVPKVYWDYTTTKILTLEYMPGIKVDDRQGLQDWGINPQEINTIGICCYLKQLLIDGFFQADPHPGNMAVHRQRKGIIFYDFGMMYEITALNKDEMLVTFFAVLRKDTDNVVSQLIKMGLVEPVSDMKPVRRLITFLLDKFTEKPIDFQAFSEIRSELYVMFEQQPFRLPAQMTYILKALTTLDGVARNLDPQYNLVAAAQPFVKSITVAQGQGNLIGTLARQTKDFIQYKLQQPSQAEVLFRRLEAKIAEGELEFQVRSVESDRAMKRIYLAIKSLIYALLTGFSFLVGVVLFLVPYPSWAIAVLCLGAIFCVFLLRSLAALSFREKLDKLAEK